MVAAALLCELSIILLNYRWHGEVVDEIITSIIQKMFLLILSLRLRSSLLFIMINGRCHSLIASLALHVL